MGVTVLGIQHRSLSARRAWIEIMLSWSFRPVVGSLSARRAWIEIDAIAVQAANSSVALRKESVDRNLYYQDNRNRPAAVALRKESVDRNSAGREYDTEG